MAEYQIQIALCQQLRTRGKQGVVWFHPANGGFRSKREAAKFRAMGLRAGVSDIIAVYRKEIFALEIKSDGGRPTESQLEFQDDMRAQGAHCVVAEGLDEAIRCLEYWQLLRPEARS